MIFSRLKKNDLVRQFSAKLRYAKFLTRPGVGVNFGANFNLLQNFSYNFSKVHSKNVQ